MANRLKTLLYIPSVAFLLALFSWILIRTRHRNYLGIVAAIAVLRIVGPHLGARLRETAALRFLRRAADHRGSIMIPFGPLVFVGIAIALRVWWAVHFEIQPISDFKLFFEESSALAHGGWGVLGTSKSPVTVLFYAAFFRVFGASLGLVVVINALLGALQAVLAYMVARRVFASTAAAYLAGLAVAVFPSLVMQNALPSSEVVFCTVLLLMLRRMLRLTNPARVVPTGALVATAALLGFETAVLHLTRNTGILIGSWIFVVGLVWVRATTARARTVALAAFVATTMLFLAPQIAYNYHKYGYFSIQSSKYAALNLLSGTNIRARGRDNRRDRMMVKTQYSLDDKTWPEVSKELRRIALKRINKDRRAFLKFALTKKFDVMWCIDQYGATNIRWNKKFDTAEMDRKAEPWEELSNRFYIFAVLAGALGLCIAPARDPAYRAFVVTASGVLFVTVLLHLFIEAQPRYHVAIVYLLAVLAGAVFEKHGARTVASASVPDVAE